jgi:lauroyl/myristoyl acyltransferase
METVPDPAVQRWFMESRSRVGVRVIPLKDARRPMVQALKAGESVGMVNDRDITHTGIPVPFFGHDTPMSPAPALLAIEANAPLYVGSARRLAGGRYGGKLWLVPTPDEGTRRERVIELTRRSAVAFESILADAPEQWWGAFHPIWPDLAVVGADAGTPGRPARDPRGPDPDGNAEDAP